MLGQLDIGQLDSARHPKCQFISTKPHGILLQNASVTLPSNLTKVCNICVSSVRLYASKGP